MLTERQQQVLQAILTQPDVTLEEIANQIGITRERVRQLYERLREGGLMIDRKARRKELIEQKKEEERAAREQRKRMWRKMMFIGWRQRLRFMASIDHRGMVRGYHMPGEEAQCQFKGCTHPVQVRGFCRLHYHRLRYTGALWVRRSSRYMCKEEDCYMPMYARGLCRNHYAIYIRKNPNPSAITSSNTSGYRGVTKATDWNGWIANIRTPEGKQEYLGSFRSKDMAARAYDTAARKYHGEKARLNFPDEHIEIEKQGKRGVIGERGISWETRKSRYIVRVTRNGERIYVGSFLDLDEAIRARDAATRERNLIGRTLVPEPAKDVSAEELRKLNDWNEGKPL